MRSITATWLGRVSYDEAHRLQEKLVEARNEGRIGDVIVMLEHDSVITLGRGANAANVVASEDERRARGVELVETGRGGDVTFHGPGQLVAYPILDLKPDRCDVRKYVRDLSQVMIELARARGVAAGVLPGDSKLIGVWVDANAPTEWNEARALEAAAGKPNGIALAKIGAIGVRLSRWITMHGFAFNVSTNLAGFGLIVPCGIQTLGVTSLAALGKDAPPLETFAREVLAPFGQVFDANVTFDAEGTVLSLV